MSKLKKLSTEIQSNGDEKYNRLLSLFHIGTEVKRELLDNFLNDKQINLLDWLTSRSNKFLLFEDVKNARRKSAFIVLDDLVLNTIDTVLCDCSEIFWDCCLKNASLEDILNRHKTLLYRKYVNSNSQHDSNSLTEDQWDTLFKRKRDIETHQEENEQCLSASKDITVSRFNSKLNVFILSIVCPLFKSVIAVSECQIQISKIAVLQREVNDIDFDNIWDKFEEHIYNISSHCRLFEHFKRKCNIIKEAKFDRILTKQNRKSILVEAFNFPDFITDKQLCDLVRKELELIIFEDNLNLARTHCGSKIPVTFANGQGACSYSGSVIENAENNLQILSSLRSSQVPDAYLEEMEVSKQTDDKQERLHKYNHLKIVQLITEIARDVLADVLKERIPSDGFGASFDGMKNKILPLLDIQERQVLYPENSNYKGDLSDLDISLIYIILRNLNTICPHKNGWGNKPNDGDRCLSANIDRIRIAKNVHVSHCSKRLLNDEDFLKTWKEIRQCIIELVEPLPSCIPYVVRIDFLLTSEINPGTEIELQNMHERAKKEERRLEEKINYMQECINDIQYQLSVNNRQLDNEINPAESLGNSTQLASQKAPDMAKKPQVTDTGIKIARFGNVTLELRIVGEDIPSIEEIEPYSQTLTTHEVRIKFIKEGSIIIGLDVSQSAFQDVGHFLQIIDTLVSSVLKRHIQNGNDRSLQASVSLDFLDNNNEQLTFSKRSLQCVEDTKKRDKAAICYDVMCGTESVQLRNHQQMHTDLTICQPSLFQRSISDTEKWPRILSCFKQTDRSPGSTCLLYTDGTYINHKTRDTGRVKQYEHVCNNLKGFETDATDANLCKHTNTYKSLLDQSSRQMATVALLYFAFYNLYIECSFYLMSAIALLGKTKIPDCINRLQTSAEIEENSKNSILTTRGLETIAEKAISSRMEDIHDHQNFSVRHCDTVSKDIVFVGNTQKECMRKTKASYNVLSLKKYFESISSGTPVTHVDPMSNELLRLSSYSSFPRDINISLIKLAKTGFYYTGGRNTECFFCGATYGDWKSGNNPVIIHRMLSPSCELVAESEQGMQTFAKQELGQAINSFERLQIRSSPNVVSNNFSEKQVNLNNSPTSRDITISSSEKENSKETKISCEVVAEIESGIPSSANQEKQLTVIPNCYRNFLTQQLDQDTNHSEILQICSSSNGVSNNVKDIEDNSIKSPTSKQITITSTRKEKSEEMKISNANLNATGTSSCQHESKLDSLEINIEKPRYPDYACLTVRISSFGGWPSYSDQSPRQTAGFLFTGDGGYVRCFFCTGGLKNWESVDDPWVKHSRWFPKCTFLKQNKGEDFINAIQKIKEGIDRQTNATNENNQETVQRVQTSASAVNESTTNCDKLDTVAVRSVREMGYTDREISIAIQYLITFKPYRTNFSAIDLMDVLCNKIPDPNEQEATIEVTTHTQNTKYVGELKPESTSNECSDIDNLIEDSRQLRKQRLSEVYSDLQASISFLLYGRIVCCTDCARTMRNCPVCRKYFKEIVK